MIVPNVVADVEQVQVPVVPAVLHFRGDHYLPHGPGAHVVEHSGVVVDHEGVHRSQPETEVKSSERPF